MSHFYPIYVDLQNKPVLVVGGGTVAFRKVKALLEHGAVVRIISPKLLPQLAELLDFVRCTFIVPSILECGDLGIAVSTGGSSPGVARQIRVEPAERYGDASYKEYLTLLRNWRKEVKARLSGGKKKRFLDRVTDGEILQLIQNGRLDEAKGVAEKCFRSLLA